MKAMVFETPGPPEVLKYRDISEKSPRRGEVLVRIHYSGVNRIDTWIRSGVYKVSTPRVLGADASGVVEEVGDEVENVRPGDRVVVNPAITCGKCNYCLSGWDSLCENLSLLGYAVDGTYAEKIVVPSVNLHPVPSTLDMSEAAAIMVTYLTAWHALVTRAGLTPGLTVLVMAGGSGVGVAAIQLCKLLGATVLTTVGEDWKVEKAHKLGADYVINRKKQNIREAVLDFTKNDGVDIVLEHVGETVWPDVVKSLKMGGKMVFLGATTGENGLINIRYAYRRQLSILGSYLWNKQEISRVLNLFAKGLLKPVIANILPLSEAAEAHRIMESDNFFGKIILKP